MNVKCFGLCAAVAVVVLSGCSTGNGRFTGILDPICMPDGSVVWVQYPNSKGEYDNARGDWSNCTWNEGKSKQQS